MSPWAPRKPCATPGCPALIPSGGPARCPTHHAAYRQALDQARRFDPVRQAAVRLYRSAAWRRLRAAILAESPLCSDPGCGAPAAHVDHVTPLRAGGAPLDRANLHAYCARHHSAKSTRTGERYGEVS